MALSAALITGLILFLPRTDHAGLRESLIPGSPSVSVSAPPSSIPSSEQKGSSMLSVDPTIARSEEIRAQLRKRCQEVQEKLRLDLSQKPPAIGNLEKMIEELRRELLTTKFLVLGEQLFEGSNPAEANRKALLDYLEKELKILADQKALLDELRHDH